MKINNWLMLSDISAHEESMGGANYDDRKLYEEITKLFITESVVAGLMMV